jgi:hypothetical protein
MRSNQLKLKDEPWDYWSDGYMRFREDLLERTPSKRGYDTVFTQRLANLFRAAGIAVTRDKHKATRVRHFWVPLWAKAVFWYMCRQSGISVGDALHTRRWCKKFYKECYGELKRLNDSEDAKYAWLAMVALGNVQHACTLFARVALREGK